MSAAIDDEEIEFPPFEATKLAPAEGNQEEPPVKRTRRKRADAGKPRAPRAVSTAKLEEELLLPIAKLGQALSFSLPTVGAVLIQRGEVTSKALVSYAQGHPKMLEALRKLGKVGPASDLIETVAMCVIAANLDLQRMHPAHPVARLSGVSAVYMEMHQYMQDAADSGDSSPQADPMAGGFDNIQPAPPSYLFEGMNEDGTFEAPPTYRAGEGAAVRNND